MATARNKMFDCSYVDGQKTTGEGVSAQTSFTIDNVKAMKRDLEKRIGAMLLEFCSITGMTIDYINVETVEDFLGDTERYRVLIEAKL